MTERPGRRGYLDWMRGLAVVIMVGWHTLDAWTTPVDKASGAFWYCQLIGGFGAPIFLFLAGVSVALAAGSRLRKAFRASPGPRRAAPRPTPGLRPASSRPPPGLFPASPRPRPGLRPGSPRPRPSLGPGRGQAWAAAWPMVKRGGWIWVLAILFRVQSDVLGGRTSLGQLLVLDIVRGNTLKVDILNVMGPAIAGAAVLWGLARTAGWRIAGSIAAASASPSPRRASAPGRRSTRCPTPSRATSGRSPAAPRSRSFRGPASCSPAPRSACSSIARATPHPSAG